MGRGMRRGGIRDVRGSKAHLPGVELLAVCQVAVIPNAGAVEGHQRGPAWEAG